MKTTPLQDYERDLVDYKLGYALYGQDGEGEARWRKAIVRHDPPKVRPLQERWRDSARIREMMREEACNAGK